MNKKWKIIFEYLFDLIKNNIVLPGETLPSQNMLKTKFKFSEQPIRLAFNKLIELKIVEAVHGKGFIVAKKMKNNILFGFKELFPNSVSDFYDFKEEIVSKDFSNISGFQVGEKVYSYKSNRKIENEIAIFQQSWLSYELFKECEVEYLFKKGLMKYIENKTQIQVSHSRKKISISNKLIKEFNFELKDKEDRHFTVVDTGNLFDVYGNIIEFRISHYKPEFFNWEFIEWRK